MENGNKYIERTIKIAHDNPRRSNRGGEKSLSSAAYNAMLLSKGILLNTTIYFEDFILNSGNAMAIEKLNQKKHLHSQGALQSQLDSLDYEILNMLSREGLEFSIPHLDVTWKDVQGALNNNDVAIEFYRTGGNDYGAIIIKRGWKSPKIIRLTNDVNINPITVPIILPINVEHITKMYLDRTTCLLVIGNVKIYLSVLLSSS